MHVKNEKIKKSSKWEYEKYKNLSERGGKNKFYFLFFKNGGKVIFVYYLFNPHSD